MRVVATVLLFLFTVSAAFASQEKKTLKLRLQSPSGNVDDATLYFDEGITPSYDFHEDAAKIFNNVEGVPQIYSLTADSVPCSINGCGDLSNASNILIGYKVGFKGLYTISAATLDNFDPTTIIRLEDKQLGVVVDLRENFYQVLLDTNSSGADRFVVHISHAVQYGSSPSNCANNGGKITVTPDSTITWALCQLFGANNQLLATDSNVTSQVVFSNLASGDYKVIFTYNQYIASYGFLLTGNYVIADIATPPPPIYTGEDVLFSAETANATTYEWDFGDGTLIAGVANATQRYLVPGEYTVNLYCTNNLGCSANAQVDVTVLLATGVNNAGDNTVSVITHEKTLTINTNNAIGNDAEIQVHNLLGQSVYYAPLKSQVETINLEEQPAGYYLVSIKNEGKMNTKRVFLAR